MSASPPKRLAPSVLNSTLSKTKSHNNPGESLPSRASYGFRMGPLGGFKAFHDYPTNLHLLSSRKDGLTHLPKFLGFQNNSSMKAFKAEPKQAPIAHNLLSSARNEKRTYASIGSTNISQRRSYRGIHHSPNRPETSDLSVLNDSLEGIQSQDSFYGAMFGPTATQANQDEVVTSPISQRFPQKRQSSREPMKKRDVIIDKLPAFDMSPKLSSRRGERSLKVLGFGNQVSRESLMNVSTEPEKSPRRSLNRSISERLAQIKKNKELIQNLETPDLYIGRSLPQKLDTEHQKPTNPDASSDYYSPSLPGNKETRKTPHSPLARGTEKRLTLTKTPSSEGNKGRRSHRRIGFGGGPLTNPAFGDSHLIMKTEPSRRSGLGGRTGNLNMTNTLIHH